VCSTLWGLELPIVFPFYERGQTTNGTKQREESFEIVRKTKYKITKKKVERSLSVRLSIFVVHINTQSLH